MLTTMKYKANKVVLLVLVVASLAGCFGTKPGGKEYREVTKLNGSDNSRMIKRFEEYPIDKQLDIVLYSDDPRFGPILARGGPQNIPAIVDRISRPDVHMLDKYQLTMVLHRINQDCRCIKSDSEIIQRLEAVGRSNPSGDYPSNSGTDTYTRMYLDSVSLVKRQLDTSLK